jgi:hypothetical protein
MPEMDGRESPVVVYVARKNSEGRDQRNFEERALGLSIGQTVKKPSCRPCSPSILPRKSRAKTHATAVREIEAART